MKNLLRVFVVITLSLFFVGTSKKAHAASLLNASASATTSRPSAAAPLTANSLVGASSVVVADNTSTYLSSDSAKFFNSGVFSENIKVATTSADRLTVFLSTTAANAHGLGASVLVNPITAMHKFIFTTQTAIPTSGTIEITYPVGNATDTNQSSPSAATWIFNGQTTGNIQVKFSQGTATCSWAVTATANSASPKLVCTVGTAVIPANTTVTILVGCSAISGADCTTQVPNIMNPTTTPGNARGVALVRNINVSTYNVAAGTQLDTATIKMGTIESVFVVAHVDPTFTFQIDGITAGASLTALCGGGYGIAATSAGFDTTPTEVNLGTITSSSNRYAAQKFTVTTNAGNGYTITATTSGHLINPASGIYLQDAQLDPSANNFPIPVALPGSPTNSGAYGISACDSNSRVNGTFWGTATPLFANPSSKFFYTLVNYTGTLSTDLTYVVYGVRAGSTTPPGDYWQIMTYTASATF